MHRPGIRTTEVWLVALFLAIAGLLLWRYGASISDSIKGLSYPVSSYVAARSWLKRAQPAPLDLKALAAQVVALVKSNKPQRPATSGGDATPAPK